MVTANNTPQGIHFRYEQNTIQAPSNSRVATAINFFFIKRVGHGPSNTHSVKTMNGYSNLKKTFVRGFDSRPLPRVRVSEWPGRSLNVHSDKFKADYSNHKSNTLLKYKSFSLLKDSVGFSKKNSLSTKKPDISLPTSAFRMNSAIVKYSTYKSSCLLSRS